MLMLKKRAETTQTTTSLDREATRRRGDATGDGGGASVTWLRKLEWVWGNNTEQSHLIRPGNYNGKRPNSLMACDGDLGALEGHVKEGKKERKKNKRVALPNGV
jgi:hypothetical protein